MKGSRSMQQITTIGLDLAKQVFQVHGAEADGSPVVSRKLRRGANEVISISLVQKSRQVTPFELPKVLVVVHTSRLSWRKAG
jgi:hypothetical protein